MLEFASFVIFAFVSYLVSPIFQLHRMQYIMVCNNIPGALGLGSL